MDTQTFTRWATFDKYGNGDSTGMRIDNVFERHWVVGYICCVVQPTKASSRSKGSERGAVVLALRRFVGNMCCLTRHHMC